jgi:26S proteasome regulatory subunit N7
MIETGGGDWERRNLLKVYEALYLIMKRDFVQASQRLLDTVATFTCYELLDYNTFIFYTVLLSAVTLDRPTLNKKVIRSPEILTAYHDVPHIQLFIESLYKCRYADFYRALLDLTPTMKQDRYLAPHVSYFLREVRIVAYRQFLESYKSVTLQSMAKAFNVSPAFLDEDLSRFIASGRVPCKIDKVNGVIESNHPDTKNAQYRSVLVEGDLLLSRIQKLAKIVSY